MRAKAPAIPFGPPDVVQEAEHGMPITAETVLDPATLEFYCRTLGALNNLGEPFLIGGAYAFERYTGIVRHTKDLDIFVRREQRDRILQQLERAGCSTGVPFPHWLAKAYCGDSFIDVIYSSGNGVAEVDDLWFERAVDGTVFDIPVKLCPPEEMLWSKAFVQERERYDGADVAHILRACGLRLDWPHLLWRFGENWRVLLSHLILFGFVYPAERRHVPGSVMRDLLDRLEAELSLEPLAERVCRGTLLSRTQYLVDVEEWGYADARVRPRGNMTRRHAKNWTEAGRESKAQD